MEFSVPDQSWKHGYRKACWWFNAGGLTHIFGLTSQLALQVFTLHKSSHSLMRNLSHCILLLKKEFTAKSIEGYSAQIRPGCLCFLNKIQASGITNHRPNLLPKFLKSSHFWSIELLSFCNCCGLSSNQLLGRWVPLLRPELVLECLSLCPNCSKQHLITGLLAILMD